MLLMKDNLKALREHISSLSAAHYRKHETMRVRRRRTSTKSLEKRQRREQTTAAMKVLRKFYNDSYREYTYAMIKTLECLLLHLLGAPQQVYDYIGYGDTYRIDMQLATDKMITDVDKILMAEGLSLYDLLNAENGKQEADLASQLEKLELTDEDRHTDGISTTAVPVKASQPVQSGLMFCPHTMATLLNYAHPNCFSL